jgi:chemotaxis response regulator CheB
LGKTRVLVAVDSRALQRLIQHLLSTAPDITLLPGRGRRFDLARAVRRSLPDLVVANARISRADARGTVAAIKGSHPGLKLIMVCSVDGFARDLLKCGADACLAEERLVRLLKPTILALSGLRNQPIRTNRGR